MKRIPFFSLLLISLLSLTFSISSSFAANPAIQVTPVTPQDREVVEQAIYQAVDRHEADNLATLIYQTRVMDLVFSADAQWARAWIISVDTTTGETAPIEPGLAVVRKDNMDWIVYLQADAAWLAAIQASPESLFPPEEKSMWTEMYKQAQVNLPVAPFSGYRLPWKAGETRSLSQSVLHDKYDASRRAHYAFDFYQPGSRGLMWDIYAAKSGTVYLAVDSVPTCYDYHCDGQGSGNYIVLKDTTTTPTSYQLYLHLAQNSIPPSFKVIGTQVIRGEFIGVADNTGASYGNHLHFMVHTYPGWWGQSADITFEDVAINGGRPRVQNQWYDDEPYCLHKDGFNDTCDNFQSNYVSHNVPCQIPDNAPPNGALTAPDTDGASVTNSISMAGWGEDTLCGLAAGQFIANYDGAWQNIGPSFTISPFTYEWDICSVPDGPLEVGLRLTDLAANSEIVGVRSLSKDYSCPAPPVPACTPDANEVMLFDGSEYTGTCQPFVPGDNTDLGVLEGQTSSLLVGANVQATLYLNDDYTGRGETFYVNDNNLSDNRVGANAAGAIRVNWRVQQSYQPILRSPLNGSDILENDVITLFWDSGIATSEWQILVTSNVTDPITSPWQVGSTFFLEGLPAGEYTWQVRGRNPVSSGPWSEPFTFNITGTTPVLPSIVVPYTDTMETNPTNWLATGFWRLIDNASLAHSGTHSWWYQDNDGDYASGQPNAGDLTSPQFTITTSGHYYLRFYYRYTTETQGPYWDQRWVQISYDGGPFRQANQSGQRQQLTDDPFAGELSYPYLSNQVLDLGILQPGQTVSVRFHFATLDENFNDFQGWAIDDVGITTTPPDASGDPNEPNDTPSQAIPISIGTLIEGVIQPGGDFDFYRFNASAGDRIVADIDAQSLGSLLDPYLYLLDNDGVSILAQNDDEIYAQNRDSFLEFIAPKDGIYYLKLRAWNNPDAGGSQYDYQLHLYIDNTDPVMNFQNPAAGSGYLNSQDVFITASAEDLHSGLSQVDFYFHDNDWLTHNWELLGSDTNGADGWSAPFNQPDQSGVALYVKAIDKSRNVAGQGYWNLDVDRTPPQTSIIPLTTTQTSTAFLLEWTGSDNLSGLRYYQLEWATDGGAWQTYPLTFTGYTQSTWIVGAPGHNYAFRLSGVDIAGNSEALPSNPDTNTSIPANVCTSPDVWELDNIATSASQILINQIQNHNLCNPLDSEGLSDTDWIKFSAQAGQHYLFHTIPTALQTATVLSIYTGNGTDLTLRAEFTQTVWGKSTILAWTAMEDEVLYIRVRHSDGRIAGSSVRYKAYVTNNYPVYLPVIARRP